jgi:glyoxylase-like metal-dependent hydrolase (beta-lactamase superfamily II)
MKLMVMVLAAVSCQALEKVADLGGGAELYVHTDTANAYVIRQGEAALLIDLGDGGALAELAKIGVTKVEWVLFTHHHREQLQGFAKLKAWSPKIGAPEAEREIFENPFSFRKMKPSLADRHAVHGSSYLRVPKERIAVDRGFAKMDDFVWRGLQFHCIETKGNSPGSMSYLLQTATGWIAFSGDVTMDGARMHTWFDTEWDYGFAKGLYAQVESAALLEQFNPALLLPSHGKVVRNAKAQLAEFQYKLRALEPLYVRGYSIFRFSGADQDRTSKPTAIPHVWQVSPHLYKFKGPEYAVNFYLILADSGKGLLVDCGLLDRAFLDKSILRMQEKLGLKKIDACIVTHMHGDHMLEAQHLREKWGVEVWALDNMVDKMERPERYDYVAAIEAYPRGVPSLKVDRSFKPGERLDWEGYQFTVDWMPGQTEFALAVRGEIDGRKVVFTGDNLFGSPADPAQNGHEAVVSRNSSVLEEGYIYGAEYLKRIQPDIILGGHSHVMDRPAAFIERYRQWAYDIRAAFRAAMDAEPGVRIAAFDITLDGKHYGEYFDLIVEVQPVRRN